MHRPHPKLLDLLSTYEPRIGRLALALRKMVLEEAPTATEEIWGVWNGVALSFSYSRRPKKGFLHVVSYSGHVELNSIMQLPAICVSGPADLKRPELRSAIRLAIQHAPRVPARQSSENQVIIRMRKGKKRRPREQ